MRAAGRPGPSLIASSTILLPRPPRSGDDSRFSVSHLAAWMALGKDREHPGPGDELQQAGDAVVSGYGRIVLGDSDIDIGVEI